MISMGFRLMCLDFYNKSGLNCLASFIKMFVVFTKSMSFPGSCKRIFDRFPTFTCLMFPQVCTFCIFRSTITEWPCFSPSHICCILLSCGPGKSEFWSGDYWLTPPCACRFYECLWIISSACAHRAYRCWIPFARNQFSAPKLCRCMSERILLHHQ